MIQFKRGKTDTWRKVVKTPLASGQPGYDKEKNKIKVGDGSSAWSDLPYTTGLHSEEILNDEATAAERLEADAEDITLFTYGTEAPGEETTGKVYLQYYATDPETDYIVESGINGNWTYQKWKSGVARCWCTTKLVTNVQNVFDGVELYYDNKSMASISYPFTFKSIPSETATIHSPSSPGNLVWLASRGTNSTSSSAIYSIISADKLNSASYSLDIQVAGYWK